MNTNHWDYYWNEEPGDRFRANLVYTAYISPDRNTLCMSFNRDINYHSSEEENLLWTEDLLTERFNREIKFYNIAKKRMPVADIVDVVESKREIYIRFPKDDFYMMGYRSSYDSVLPNWKEQIIDRFKEMWGLKILKFSIHPNSWIVYEDGILRPFNWFFTFDEGEEDRTINDFMIQISNTRRDTLEPVLKSYGLDLNTKYTLKKLQSIALESFKKNYPHDIIEKLKQLKLEFHQ